VVIPYSTSFVYDREGDVGALCSCISGALGAGAMSRMGAKSGVLIFNKYVTRTKAGEGSSGAPQETEEMRSDTINQKDKSYLAQFVKKKTSPTRF